MEIFIGLLAISVGYIWYRTYKNKKAAHKIARKQVESIKNTTNSYVQPKYNSSYGYSPSTKKSSSSSTASDIASAAIGYAIGSSFSSSSSSYDSSSSSDSSSSYSSGGGDSGGGGSSSDF